MSDNCYFYTSTLFDMTEAEKYNRHLFSYGRLTFSGKSSKKSQEVVEGFLFADDYRSIFAPENFSKGEKEKR